MSVQPSAPPAAAPAPTLRRRLASVVYESMLLFGIAFGAAFVYSVSTGQQHALQGRLGLLVTVIAAVAAYFLWCWTRSGQTLAMQTWRLQLVDARSHRPPGGWKALWRFVLAWLWLVPGVVAVAVLGWQAQPTRIAMALLSGMLAYAALAWVLPGRQFLHDVLAGTRIETAPARRTRHRG